MTTEIDETQRQILLRLLGTGITRDALISVLRSRSEEEWRSEVTLAPERGGSSSAARPPELGSNVILTGGAGSKRRFDGKAASVVEYPRAGCWMTVRVVPADSSSSSETNDGGPAVFKWRKSGCTVLSGGEDRPLGPLDLSDDSLTHIFSYLAHGTSEEDDPCNRRLRLLWVKKAARLHVTIASICRRLREFSEVNIKDVLGYLDANFDGLHESRAAECMMWMCKYQLRLGRMKVLATLHDLPLLRHLVQSCDMDRARQVHFRMEKRGGFYSGFYAEASRFIGPAWTSRFRNRSSSVPYPSERKMAQDLGIPFGETTYKAMLESIAEICHGISHLAVNVQIPPSRNGPSYSRWERDYSTLALCSLRSLTHLDLSISSLDSDVDSCFINKIIQNMECLEELKMGACAASADQMRHKRLHIESASLRVLNVKRMGKKMWVSCECPKLERYVCDGSDTGNGTRPDFTFEQMRAHVGNVVRADSTSLIGLEVPPTCRCLLLGFHETNDLIREEYDEYQSYLDDFIRQAVYWTPRQGAGTGD